MKTTAKGFWCVYFTIKTRSTTRRWPAFWTISQSRKGAIAKYIDERQMTWKRRYARGDRCVRIQIQPEEKR